MYVLRVIGLSDDIALSMVFFPILGLWFWNRQSEQDRFNGMAFPVLFTAFFLSVSSLTIERIGLFFEIVYAITLAGTIFGIFWVMTLLLTLWGAKTGPFS